MGTATLACAILGTLMVIVFPAVTKRIIDEVLNQHRPERLTPACPDRSAVTTEAHGFLV
jgi:ATP-binding cassette, subfamily B, bacterial